MTDEAEARPLDEEAIRADERRRTEVRVAEWLRGRAEHYLEDLFPRDGDSRECIAAHALRRFSLIWSAGILLGDYRAEDA